MTRPPIESTFVNLIGKDITSAEKIAGGRNSRVFRVTAVDGTEYAVKHYFRSESDSRDRLRIEYGSLKFLWGHGISSIPRPINSDFAHGCAVYEFIQGRRIAAAEVEAAHIDQMVEFIAALKRLPSTPESSRLFSASEACFCGRDVVDAIYFRLRRLQQHRCQDDNNRKFHDFLQHDFIPTAEKLIAGCRRAYDRKGFSFETAIGLKERTLSPSDFGCHNALVRPDGSLVFLDFEYFGWDDPAKMICDVLLHPAMALTRTRKHQFLERTLSLFEEQHHLKWRVQVLYPLHGLKWCLILLNEFIPAEQQRRRFAASRDVDLPALQAGQLAKAVVMLQKVISEPLEVAHDAST